MTQLKRSYRLNLICHEVEISNEFDLDYYNYAILTRAQSSERSQTSSLGLDTIQKEIMDLVRYITAEITLWRVADALCMRYGDSHEIVQNKTRKNNVLLSYETRFLHNPHAFPSVPSPSLAVQ